MKLLILALLISSAIGAEITCEFSDINWSILGTFYTCTVVNFEPLDDALNIKSVVGTHLSGKTNADVETINFSIDKCSQFGCYNIKFMPKGFQNFFGNLVGLKFSLAFEALNSDDLIKYPNLQFFSSSNVAVKNIPKCFFAYAPEIKYINFNNNGIKNVADGTFDNLPELKVLFLGNNSCINQGASTSDDVAILIQNVKVLCPPKNFPSRSCDDTIESEQEISLNFTRVSCNQCFKLILQTDGNLVVYQNGAPSSVVWASNTKNRGVVRGAFEPNGKLKLYSPTAVVFETEYIRSWIGGAVLRAVVKNTGELTIWDTEWSQPWTNGVGGICPTTTTTTTTLAPRIFDSIELTCNFFFGYWAIFNKAYACDVIDVKFLPGPNNVIKINGQHLAGHSNNNVVMVSFSSFNCPKFNVTKIPQGLELFFPNFVGISLYTCGINSLRGDELANYVNLRSFSIAYSNVAIIPGNLFRNNLNLQIAYFSYNKITQVGEGLFDGLAKLEQIHFGANVCINKWASYGGAVKGIINDLKKLC